MHTAPPQEFSVAVDLLGSLNLPIEPRMLSMIMHAARAGTLTILRNEVEVAVGFVCWAGGNKESLKVAHRFGHMPGKFWEFKEGKVVVIMFVLFLNTFSEEAARAFTHFLRSHRVTYYKRKNAERLLLRTSKGYRFLSTEKLAA